MMDFSYLFAQLLVVLTVIEIQIKINYLLIVVEKYRHVLKKVMLTFLDARLLQLLIEHWHLFWRRLVIKHQTAEAKSVGSYEAQRMTMIEELEAIVVCKKRIGCKFRKSMALLRKQVLIPFPLFFNFFIL